MNLNVFKKETRGAQEARAPSPLLVIYLIQLLDSRYCCEDFFLKKKLLLNRGRVLLF